MGDFASKHFAYFSRKTASKTPKNPKNDTKKAQNHIDFIVIRRFLAHFIFESHVEYI
jgi:hypothetical protein